jgi:ABC-type uncharacterized transport system auxiliary subunit
MKKLIILLFVALLSGCGSEDMSQFFYIYEKPDFPQRREKPLPHSLLVNDFAASSWLHTRQIAVILYPNRIDYYDEYGWIAFPGELFAEQLYELFKDSNIFTSVSRRASKGGFDFFIEGYINHLEMVKKGDSLFAWINMDLELSKSDVSSPLVTSKISEYLPLGREPKIRDFVSAVFKSYNRHAVDFILKCEERIEQK